ncbi:unnamed protein product [Paramecium octaurelia]|uniref:non-specific serine/threonine protein kinase n=1 Tax=Paramecium octaurelia TaxID=43137 RepID=A0A8S1S7R5_PAROT|nr:unnamed protein product [Paramecium octaurelia]
MGGCEFKFRGSSDDSQMTLNNFELISVVGQGGFGKVYKARLIKTRNLVVALKVMSKVRVIQKKSVSSVMNELQILSTLRHEFIINIISAFQDRCSLYLAMDFLAGGDLRFHLCKFRKFSEAITKHIAICIIIGLDYIHSNGIIHRDIKPENLVFDSQGYLRITDFGIARIWKPQNSHETSGTPGYMAPEVMCRQNHGVAVDYFALGIIIHECILGKRPYTGKSRQEIRDQIIAKQAAITEVPQGWSVEAISFANALMQRKPQSRLGCNGPEEVKNHPWFKNIKWTDYEKKHIGSPFIPDEKLENYLKSNQLESLEDQSILHSEQVQQQFFGYEHLHQLNGIPLYVPPIVSPRTPNLRMQLKKEQ